MSTLSIVIPVASYNVAWLGDAIDSALHLADELIIVTDGDVYHPSFNKGVHRIIETPNRNSAMATNIGFAAATCEWVSFGCSDDYYDFEASYIKSNLEHYQAEIVGGVCRVFDNESSGTFWPKWNNVVNIRDENCIASAAFMKKEVWWRCGGFEDVRYWDWHFWQKAIGKFHFTYYFEPLCFYHHRNWPGSISASMRYQSNLGLTPGKADGELKL